MIEHEINKLDNFICGWYLEDTTICDNLIKHHQSKPLTEGKLVYNQIDHSYKKSFDTLIEDEILLKTYNQNLQSCCDEYIKKYHWCNEYSAWSSIETPRIQMYEPSGAFYAWHTERTNAQFPSVSRHLVFMTYLNDVSDDGETEFYYQKIKIKPEKGLTLIWPSDWTFTHRGIPSSSQTKYIVTGWFNYV